MAEPIGIIAAGGRLPIVMAEGVRAAGRQVCVIGIRGHYPEEIVSLSDRFTTVAALRLASWSRACRRFGVSEAILVGRFDKGRMHDPLRFLKNIPDLPTMFMWYRQLRKDRRSHVVLRSIADQLHKGGVRLIDSTTYIPEHMATEGVLTRCQPNNAQMGDIELGWNILGKTVELEIGQAISVRDRDVIAVEALEGTDRLIERTGELCPKRGWTLLKTASSTHDMRSDVPTIGVNTIEMMKRHGGTCLAVGSGRVILLEKQKVLKAADEAGIAIIGIGNDGQPGA